MSDHEIAAAIERLQSFLAEEVMLGSLRPRIPDRAVIDLQLSGGATAVMKINIDPSQQLREYEVLESAASSGVPVPKVILFDPAPPSLLVLETLNGVPLAECDEPDAWKSAGRVIRQIHSCSVPASVLPLGERGGWWKHHLKWLALEIETREHAADIDARLIRRVDAMARPVFEKAEEPDPLLIHGDCQAEHFYIRRGAPSRVEGVLDFGDACVGDVVWDIAVLTLWHPENLRQVLSGYGGGDLLFDRAHRLVPAYQLLRLLGEITWLRQFGLPTDRQSQELAARAT